MNTYINTINAINDNYNNLDFEEMNIDFNINLYDNQKINKMKKFETTFRQQVTIEGTNKVKELSTWDSNDTVIKDVLFDRVTMLEPTVKNMHILMLKINELVCVINELTLKK